MYLQRGRLLLGSEFDDVRVSNRCTTEINDAAVNVGNGSGALDHYWLLPGSEISLAAFRQ